MIKKTPLERILKIENDYQRYRKNRAHGRPMTEECVFLLRAFIELNCVICGVFSKEFYFEMLEEFERRMKEEK